MLVQIKKPTHKQQGSVSLGFENFGFTMFELTRQNKGFFQEE